jgi:hypothetical protein
MSDFVVNAIDFLVYFDIPEANNTNAASIQEPRTPFIMGLRLKMLIAVDFDREFQQRTVKIQNIRPDRMLPPERDPET